MNLKDIFNKNKDEKFKIDNIDIKNKINQYYSSKEIISPVIKSMIDIPIKKKTKEDMQYVENLAKISLYVDYLLDSKKTNQNTNNKEISISNEKKELLTECIFSAGEYLLENHKDIYPNFNTFFDSLQKKVKKLEFPEKINDESTNGMSKQSNILIKNKHINSSNDIFAILFSHEFSHRLGNSKTAIGLMDLKRIELNSEIKIANNIVNSVTTVIQDTRSFVNKYANLDDMQTEYLAMKFLQKNFPDFFKENEYRIYLQSEDKRLTEIFISGNFKNYKEISKYAEPINLIFQGELENSYLKNDLSITTILENPKFRPLKSCLDDFLNNYQKDAENMQNWEQENETHNAGTYNSLHNSFMNLIETYLKENELTDEEYFKLTKSILKNKIIIGNSEISLNEVFVADLDCQRFDKYYANSPSKEIIKILKFMKGDKSEELSNPEERGLYKALKDINKKRELCLKTIDLSF